MSRVRSMMGLAAGAAAGLVLLGGAPAHAGGSAGEVGATLSGTGHLLRGGESAQTVLTVTCPRGETWEATGTFVFAELGDDDTVATAVGSGKCAGREQRVKLRLRTTYNPPIPANCSAEYLVAVTFSTGETIGLDHGAAGPTNSGPVCFR